MSADKSASYADSIDTAHDLAKEFGRGAMACNENIGVFEDDAVEVHRLEGLKLRYENIGKAYTSLADAIQALGCHHFERVVKGLQGTDG